MYADFLGTSDRNSRETQSYIETYDLLAARNAIAPVESNEYVEHLAERFAGHLGELKGRSFCDVGAGRGFLVKHALRAGAVDVTAVDIAEQSLRTVARTYRVNAFLANAENLPFDQCFDVLTATDIVEHVLNVANFLVSANWSLKTGGILAVRVPYIENMMSDSNFYGLPVHFTHLRTFDRALLVHLIESAGFQVRRVHYDGFTPDYVRRFWTRVPLAKAWIERGLRVRTVHGVVRVPGFVARLLMKPIEIGAVATKVEHVTPTRYHDDLRQLYLRRRSEKQSATSLGGVS